LLFAHKKREVVMSKSFRTLIAFSTIAALAVTTLGQRPRISAPEPVKDQAAQSQPAVTPLTLVKARYEGGVVGFSRKVVGSLKLDETNERLVFHDQKDEEVLSIPYATIVAATPDTQSRSAIGPVAGTVINSTVGILGLPAMLAKRKYRYLNLQYNDRDTRMSGITSFKIDGKELLNSFLVTLAGQTGLTARGEGFVRVQKPVTSVAGDPIFSKPRASARSTIVTGKAISLPLPIYPKNAKDVGAEGSVTVYITIDENGQVIEAHAGGGHPYLQDAAVEAAKQAKFEPTQVDGQPVTVTASITYRFSL
jgi:TonB family protein